MHVSNVLEEFLDHKYKYSGLNLLSDPTVRNSGLGIHTAGHVLNKHESIVVLVTNNSLSS